MRYSKNGSIPDWRTDGTLGWIEVDEPPVPPEGKEVAWIYPPGWVVRDPAPGPNYIWIQDTQTWLQNGPAPEISTQPIPSLSSDQVSGLESVQVSGLSSGQVSSLTTDQTIGLSTAQIGV